MITKTNNNPIIKKVTRQLIKKYKPIKIVLFGSYANGTSDENSDIDLLIIKDTDKKRRVDRFIEVKKLIFDPKIKIPISPIVLTSKEVKERLSMGDNFIEEILEKGKVLYEKQDNL